MLVPSAAYQHVQPVYHVPLNYCGWQFKGLVMSRMFTFRHERTNCVERKGKFTPRSDWLGNVLFSADTRLETGEPMRRGGRRGLDPALRWRSGFLLNRSVGPDVSVCVREGSCTPRCAESLSFTFERALRQRQKTTCETFLTSCFECTRTHAHLCYTAANPDVVRVTG